MSSLKDLINFAVTGDATNLKTAFSELMADKIVDRIDNFKPQVAADMFNIAPEVQEEGKKTDHDKDGDNDFADIQIARMIASGMKKSAAVAMTKNKPYNEEVEDVDEASKSSVAKPKLYKDTMIKAASFNSSNISKMERDEKARKAAMQKEEVEELDEIHSIGSTALTYHDHIEAKEMTPAEIKAKHKSYLDTEAHHRKRSKDPNITSNQRMASGAVASAAKMAASEWKNKYMKEEVEELDELSLETMKSAKDKLAGRAKNAAMDDNKYLARREANRALNIGAKIKRKERQAANEEVEELDEISRNLASRYLNKTNPDYSTPDENKKRDPGRRLALGKKWGQALGINVPKVSATEETKYVDEARRPGRPSKKSDSAEDNDDPEDNPPFLNQLHKAKQLNKVPGAKDSHYSIAFANGPQAKISASHAHDAIMMIGNQRTTAQKDDMTKNLSKSHDSFKQLIGAK